MINPNEDLTVTIGSSKEVTAGQGDVAREWEVEVGGLSYVRQRHYDISWRREGAVSENVRKHPSEEVQMLLEVAFRQHHATTKNE